MQVSTCLNASLLLASASDISIDEGSCLPPTMPSPLLLPAYVTASLLVCNNALLLLLCGTAVLCPTNSLRAHGCPTFNLPIHAPRFPHNTPVKLSLAPLLQVCHPHCQPMLGRSRFEACIREGHWSRHPWGAERAAQREQDTERGERYGATGLQGQLAGPESPITVLAASVDSSSCHIAKQMQN